MQLENDLIFLSPYGRRRQILSPLAIQDFYFHVYFKNFPLT